MEKSKKMNVIAQIILFIATIAWGSSFVILKKTIKEVPPYFVIGIRFFSASLMIFLFFFKKILKMNKGTFLRGLALGTAVGLGYFFQTFGLMYTTPGRNAFLTSLYCVITPFLFWIIYKRKPRLYNLISAFLCVIGIGLIALSGGENGGSYLVGNLLTLCSTVFYAFQIVFISRFQEKKDNGVLLLFMELFTVGVMLLLISAVVELPKNGLSMFILNGDQILKIAYLTLICTLFAQAAQVFGLKYTSANQGALILSLEAVFGVVFSVILGEEDISAMLIIGFVIVFAAIMITETKVDFARLFNGRHSTVKSDSIVNNNVATDNISATDIIVANDTNDKSNAADLGVSASAVSDAKYGESAKQNSNI